MSRRLLPGAVATAIALSLAVPAVASAGTQVTVDGYPLIHQVAGGRSGDGGQASAAKVNATSAAVRADGSVVLLERTPRRLRFVSPTGLISSVDLAVLDPRRIDVDGLGRLYVQQGQGSVVRVADDGTKLPTTFAIYNPSTSSYDPITAWDVAADGTVYVANGMTRQIVAIAADGTRTLVAGVAGAIDISTADGPALDAHLGGLSSLAVAPDGAVLVGEQRIIRRVVGGQISTIAGVAAPGDAVDAGNGGPATAAVLWADALNVEPDGTVDVLQAQHAGAGPGVRRFSVGGTISAFLSGADACSLDAAAAATMLVEPCGLVASYDYATATRTAFAGTAAADSPDGAPASSSFLATVRGVAVRADGLRYFGTTDRLRRVGSNGLLETVAGGGAPADGLGDGLAATAAAVHPRMLAVDATDRLVFVDAPSASDAVPRVRRINTDGTVSTVAGGGSTTGAAAEGAAATDVALAQVSGLAADPAGNIYVSERYENRVRRIATDGTIATYAGGGLVDADGGSATTAFLSQPSTLAYDAVQNRLLVASLSGLRTVSSSGLIGTLLAQYSGGGLAVVSDGTVYAGVTRLATDGSLARDLGGPIVGDEIKAVDAALAASDFAPMADGSLLIADGAEVRQVDPGFSVPPPPAVQIASSAVGPATMTVTVTAAATPTGGHIQLRALPGTTAPANQRQGVLLDAISVPAAGGTYGPITFRRFGTAANAPGLVGGAPYSLGAFFVNQQFDASVPTSVTLTPEVDSVPPGLVSADHIYQNASVSLTLAGDPDFDHLIARYTNGGPAPQSLTDGNPATVHMGLTKYVSADGVLDRFQPVTYAVYSVDISGNVSDAAIVVVPAFSKSVDAQEQVGWDTDPVTHRLTTWYAPDPYSDDPVRWVRYAVGDVAPATPQDGLRPSCELCTGGLSPNQLLSYVDGTTAGTHYSFSVFRLPQDELQYTRATFRVVGGTNTRPDIISATATSVVKTGSSATIAGTVRQATTNQPRPATAVSLWARVLPSTTYVKLQTKTTSSTGAVSFTAKPTTSTYYQLRSGSTDPIAPPVAVSASRLTQVTPTLSGALSTTSVTAGHAVTLRATFRPAWVRKVYLQVYNGKWTTVTSRTTNQYGAASIAVTKPRGSYAYRWYYPASSVLRSAVSATMRFKVT